MGDYLFSQEGPDAAEVKLVFKTCCAAPARSLRLGRLVGDEGLL